MTHKGKRRLVIDLRHVNWHHIKRSCRFETLQKLRRMARRGDYMWSVDLSDAYHHVGIAEDDQRYFTFALQTLPLRGVCLLLLVLRRGFDWHS